MSQLFIDIGNSCLHWASRESGQAMTAMQVFPYHGEDMADLLTRHWAGLPTPGQVMISSVASEQSNQAVAHWLQTYFQVTPRFIRPVAYAHGVRNAYREPERLGSDRWAAMVAAFHESKSACCILGCGTATTFDVVDQQGHHLGGWIMPGYRLFQSSLLTRTSAIRLSETAPAPTGQLGQSTEECMDIAWHQGVVGLVQRTLEGMKIESLKCYITGGDAQRVISLLGAEWCYASNLVLQGLAVMASQD